MHEHLHYFDSASFVVFFDHFFSLLLLPLAVLVLLSFFLTVVQVGSTQLPHGRAVHKQLSDPQSKSSRPAVLSSTVALVIEF